MVELDWCALPVGTVVSSGWKKEPRKNHFGEFAFAHFGACMLLSLHGLTLKTCKGWLVPKVPHVHVFFSMFWSCSNGVSGGYPHLHYVYPSGKAIKLDRESQTESTGAAEDQPGCTPCRCEIGSDTTWFIDAYWGLWTKPMVGKTYQPTSISWDRIGV